MLIVKKFGGTSVGNTERIFNVAKRCIEDWQKGNDVVVVLSAMGKYTDELIDMAKQVNENPPKRADVCITYGYGYEFIEGSGNIAQRIPGGNAYDFSIR